MKRDFFMKQSSGMAGVHWEQDRGEWRVSVPRDGKRLYLGRRKTLEEAKKLLMDANDGIFPTAEEKKDRLYDKMARIRMRSVWRESTKGDHGWSSFDEFLVSVGDRPKDERKLIAKDESKPIGPDNFQWVKPKYDHLTKEGRKQYLKEHRTANPRLYKDKDLRKNFGITIEEYEEKWQQQNGVCAICSQPEKGTRNGKVRWLNVDHDHFTGEVRGLLCTNCNVAVGMLYEKKDVINKVVDYLEEHKPNTILHTYDDGAILREDGSITPKP